MVTKREGAGRVEWRWVDGDRTVARASVGDASLEVIYWIDELWSWTVRRGDFMATDDVRNPDRDAGGDSAKAAAERYVDELAELGELRKLRDALVEWRRMSRARDDAESESSQANGRWCDLDNARDCTAPESDECKAARAARDDSNRRWAEAQRGFRAAETRLEQLGDAAIAAAGAKEGSGP